MKATVKIEDYKVHCAIGVHAYERAQEQEIALDIDMEVDISACVASDSIHDVLNYEEVGPLCRDLAQEKRFHLIETYAYEAMQMLFNRFPQLLFLRVTVKKRSAVLLARQITIQLEQRR